MISELKSLLSKPVRNCNFFKSDANNLRLSGLVYLIGGMNGLGTEIRSTDSYNPVTQEVMRLADMNAKRAYVGAAHLNGFIYAVGGWNELDGALDTIERYSIDEVFHLILPMGIVLFRCFCFCTSCR